MLSLPPRSPLFPYTTLFRSFVEPLLFDLGEDGFRHVHLKSPQYLRSVLPLQDRAAMVFAWGQHAARDRRSEEHTSELQSLRHLVCRLLLEKKKDRDDQPKLS